MNYYKEISLKDLYFRAKLTDLSATIQVSVIYKNTLENLKYLILESNVLWIQFLLIWKLNA